MPNERSRDRRVQRTHDLLHGALSSLIHEKDYDAVVVKEILARANVGRSTFYAHFRDKDELLACGIRDMVPAGDAPPSSPSERAEHIASTFVLVLNWWVEHGGALSASEANVVFRALILPTMAVTRGQN